MAFHSWACKSLLNLCLYIYLELVSVKHSAYDLGMVKFHSTVFCGRSRLRVNAFPIAGLSASFIFLSKTEFSLLFAL